MVAFFQRACCPPVRIQEIYGASARMGVFLMLELSRKGAKAIMRGAHSSGFRGKGRGFEVSRLNTDLQSNFDNA
jgi:hypothetical protein